MSFYESEECISRNPDSNRDIKLGRKEFAKSYLIPPALRIFAKIQIV